MRLLLNDIVVDHAGLHLLTGHLLAQLIEAVELLGRHPHILQIEGAVKGNQVLLRDCLLACGGLGFLN